MKKINHSHQISILSGSIALLLLLLTAPLASAQSNSSAPNDENPYELNAKINPSMAIIIVVLVSAFFFMGFFSIYLRQCAGDDRSGRGNNRLGGRGRSRRGAPRGLDRAVLETFPILEYSVVKQLKLGKGTLECAVCLNEFEDDETLRLLPKCSHVFHPECIDSWLESHTTCPVCRADLVPGSETETAAGASETPDAETVTEEANRTEDSPLHSVAIDIPEESSQEPEVIDPAQMAIPVQNRPIRSKSSRRPPRFPRSHSTGHSLVHPGLNMERYTLRLPEHVRKQIVNGKLHRTTSLITFSADDGSSRGGRYRRYEGGEGSSRGGRSYGGGGGEGSGRGRRSYRGGGGGGGGGEGSSRGRGFQFGRFDWAIKSDRWVFSMAPPFFSRTLSVKSPKVADGDQPATKKTPFPSVMTPLDCLGPKPESEEQAAARGATPVFTAEQQKTG